MKKLKKINYKKTVLLGLIPLLYFYGQAQAQVLSLIEGSTVDLTGRGTEKMNFDSITLSENPSQPGNPTIKMQMDLLKLNQGEDFIGTIITNNIIGIGNNPPTTLNFDFDILNANTGETCVTQYNEPCFYITNYNYAYKDLLVNNGPKYDIAGSFVNSFNMSFPNFQIKSKYFRLFTEARFLVSNPLLADPNDKNIQYQILGLQGIPTSQINLNYRLQDMIENSFQTKTPLGSFNYGLLAPNNSWNGTFTNLANISTDMNMDKADNSYNIWAGHDIYYNEELGFTNGRNMNIEIYGENISPSSTVSTKKFAVNNISGLFTFNDPLSYLKSNGEKIGEKELQDMILDARVNGDFSTLTPDSNSGGYWFSFINDDNTFSNDPLSVMLHLGVAGVTPANSWQGKGFVATYLDTNNLGSFTANNNNDQALLINVRNKNGQLFINDPNDTLNIIKGMELYGRNIKLNLWGVSTADSSIDLSKPDPFENAGILSNHYSPANGINNNLGNSSYIIFAADNSLLNIYSKDGGTSTDEYFYNPIYGSNFGWDTATNSVKEFQDSYTTQVMSISGQGKFNFNNIKSIEQIDIINKANVNFYNPVYTNYLNIEDATLNASGDMIFTDDKSKLMFFDDKNMNVNLRNNAIWNINDNTTIAQRANGVTTLSGNITVDNSLVNLFNADKRAINLNVNSWNGANNGTVRLGAYFDNSSTNHDKITARQLFGTTKLEVYNKGASYEVLDNPIQVFEYVGNQSDAASKVGKFVMDSFTENGNTYSLTKDSATANHYIVNGNVAPTPDEQTVINIPGTTTHILAAKAAIDSVKGRIHGDKKTYLWGNGIYNQFKIEGMKNKVNLFQLGLDHKIDENLIAGGFIDYGDLSFNNDLTDGNGKSYGIGLYANKTWDTGEKLSLVYRHSNGNVKYKNYDSGKKSLNTNTINFELSKDFDQKDTTITPFADYMYSRGSGFTLSESNLIKWESPKVNFNEFTAGVKFKIKDVDLKPEFTVAAVNTHGLSLEGKKSFTDGLVSASIQNDNGVWNVKGSLSKRFGTLESTQANISISYKW